MNDKQIKRFFLSPLEDQRDEDIALTADPAIFEAAEQVESELVDDYVLGVLPASERECFERYYLTTDSRREKVAHAVRLVEIAKRESVTSVAAASRPSRIAVRTFLIGGAIAVLSGTVWVSSWITSDKPAPELSRVSEPLSGPDVTPTMESEASQPERQTDSAGPKVKDRSAKVTPATIVLSPSSLRSGGKDIVIPKEKTRVPFLMTLLWEPGARGFSGYSIRIETPEGFEIPSSSKVLKMEKSGVTFSMKSLLEEGTYIVYLNGRTKDGSDERVGEYVLRVVPR